MAINKRKVLDAARKHAQKGAKERALKEYNKLTKADPRDAKLLLEIGDAYRRWGQAEEAIAQYTKVANQYKSDGFDARAVAVLKQILNLDPKRYTAHVSLADLYQRMGLDSDAISALQTAADGYYRDGRRKEALELLRKMAALDPSNTTSRMKVADLLKQEGMEVEAVQEYEEIAAELTRQGAKEHIATVQERILEIKPKRVDVMVALAQNLSDQGRPERAEAFAVRAVDSGGEPEHYELLCGIYKSLGNDVRLAEVTRDLSALYRERGDEDKAREVIQRIPSGSLESADLGIDRTDQSAAAMLGDDELLEDEDFLVNDQDDVVTLDNELESSSDEIGASMDDLGGTIEEVPPTQPLIEEVLPDGDPDQLFAEASVYLRYGKRDQAILSLKAVLVQNPDHRGALEKLGEAHAEQGDPEAAVSCWIKAAEAAKAANDAGAYGIIRDRIGALDTGAAAELEPMGAVADDVSETADAIELDFAEEDSAEGEAEVGQDQSIELDLDISVSEEVSEETTDDSEEMAFEFEDEAAPDSAPSPTTDSQTGQSSATAAQIKEDLVEAEFYIEQGLSDEAETIYRKILSVAPNHPAVLLKLGELAASKGEDPAVTTEVSASEDGSGIDLDPDDAQADADATDGEPEVSEDLAAIMAEAEASVDVHSEADSESVLKDDDSDFDLDIDSFSSEDTSEADGSDDLSDATEVETVAEIDEAPEFTAEPVQAEPTSQTLETTDRTMPLPASDQSEAQFDLAAELADVFEDDAAAASGRAKSAPGQSTSEEGFESIFADFKKGVSEALEEGDYDTRFDLGIAYREMGLWDDAISEFQVCLASDDRRNECLHMLALCAMEIGRIDDAKNHIEQALAAPSLSGDSRVGLYFDLGRAMALSGDIDRARSAFMQVKQLDADFPGVDEQIAGIESGEVVQLHSDDDYESFDDIMSDDDDETPEAELIEAEPLESFDDVIADVEIVPEPQPDVKGDSSSSSKSKRSGRKKKISFV